MKMCLISQLIWKVSKNFRLQKCKNIKLYHILCILILKKSLHLGQKFHEFLALSICVHF